MSKHGVAALALAMVAATTVAQAQGDGVRVLEGGLGVPAGAAAGDLAVIEARRPDGRRLGEAVFRLRGTAPFAFVIAVPSDVSSTLAGALFDGGSARWVLPDLGEFGADGSADLGIIDLVPFEDLRITTAYRCGPVTVEAGLFETGAVLRRGGRDVLLDRVQSGSGARYVTADGQTEIWSRGRTALLTLEGESYPECSVSPPSRPEPWTARGNEPGWRLVVSGRDYDLVYDYGAERATGRLSAPEIASPRLEYQSQDGAIGVVVEDGLCRDDATGMPYPSRVAVSLAERAFTGCGGDAIETVQGRWSVRSIDTRDVAADLGISLEFDTDGALTGDAACNRFATEFRIGGEGVSIGPIAATRRACGDEGNRIEQAFFAALAAVDRFDFDETGALLLYSSERVALVARRPD